MTDESAKRRAALKALEYLPVSGTIGLGTGSTVRFFIEGLAALIAQGRKFSGVATSEASRVLATGLNIPLLDDAGPWQIDLCVDGADEVSRELYLIKGGGGAHTREKIVNQAAASNIIIVDESKLSKHLGEKCSVPVEVLGFGHQQTAQALRASGEPKLRLKNDQPWRTDSDNLIYDLWCGKLTDPKQLDSELKQIPGVVETGLFCDRVDRLIVAGPTGLSEVLAQR